VDLSHTSDSTASQPLNHSKAPVIWPHSSARDVHNVSRNIPDEILKLIGVGDHEGQRILSAWSDIHCSYAGLRISQRARQVLALMAPPGKADVTARR
jgi:membrane dipeptidase